MGAYHDWMALEGRKKIDLDASSSSIRSASFAQLGSKIVSVVVQLGITMVLARLLTPEEYGTVAILTAFSGLFSVFADAGISTAIAQFQDLTEDDYERLFFVSLLLGIGLAVAFFVLSIGIAWFYGDSIYVPLGAVMTLSVLFNALNMVPNGVLIKERKFSLIGVRLVVCTAVVGALVIVLALLGLGAFAIVLQSVLTALFVLIWNLAGSHLKMSFGDVRPVLSKVGRFSAYQLGSDAIVWLSGNADSLLVGKMFGEGALGYYNKAYNLYGYPTNILAAPITSTLIPFLAPLQNDVDALRRKYLGVARKVSFIVALCTAWMSVCAEEIILIMYSETWAPAIPLLQVLSLAIYARGVNSVHAPLLSATGRSDLLMRSTTVNTVVTLGMIFFGGALGSVQSLATCVAIAYNLELIIPVYLSSRYCLDMGVLEYFRNLFPDMVLTAAAILLCHFLPLAIGNVFLSLLVKAGVVLAFMTLLRILIDKLFFGGVDGSVKGLATALLAKLRR